ncbi:sialate O-acetylesterase (plasmid) [Verrucomicrobiaceae bacterium 227]
MTLPDKELRLAFAFTTTTLFTLGSATAQNTLVNEAFNGAGAALDGSTAEVFADAITTAGGSNAWVSSDTFFDNGGVAPGTSNNSSAYLKLGSYINNTKGTSAGLFELTMTIGSVTGDGNAWLSMGFSELNSPATNNHFLNNDATGTIILRISGGGELDMWGGPGGANAIDGPNNNAGDRTLTVALDLSTHNGVDDFGSVTWSDSLLGELASHAYTEDVDFSSIFLSEANGTITTLGNLTLTQVDAVVPQEEWDLYLLGGQSNAEGRALNANLPTSLQGAQADVMFFNDVDGSWTSLKPGTGGNSATGGNSSQFGPEVTLGRTLADDHPTRKIAIVKYGAGGTNLHTQWNPDDMGADNRYDDFVTTVNKAIATLPAGVSFSIRGMLWMQGENDAPATSGNGVSPNALAYEANLTNFIASVRDEFAVPDMPFIIGQLGHLKDVPVSNTNWTIVQSAQARVAALDPNVAMVINTDLPLKDLVHYNAAGQQSLGINFAKALQGQVEQLQIAGASFETAEFNNNDDGNQTDNFDSTLISGWMEDGTINASARADDTGIFNLDGTFYSNFENLDVDGSNALALSGNVSVQQSLSAVIKEGATYTLSVAIGNRDLGALQDFAGARIELLSDGQVIADSGDLSSADVVDGAFTDITFSYTADASHAGGVVGIRLLSLNENPGTSSVDFDNLRLTAVAYFEVTDFSLTSGNAVELTWKSVPGKSYTIETSGDLSNWSQSESQIEAATAPASTTTHTLDAPAPGMEKVFYRVRTE